MDTQIYRLHKVVNVTTTVAVVVDIVIAVVFVVAVDSSIRRNWERVHLSLTQDNNFFIRLRRISIARTAVLFWRKSFSHCVAVYLITSMFPRFVWNGKQIYDVITISFILLLCSYPTPPQLASALLYSCPAPFKLLSSTFLAPPQFLPSSCPLSALLCFTLLSSAPALFLPCSCPAYA